MSGDRTTVLALASNGKRVVVTGASGFVGACIAGRLQQVGWRVRGTSRRPSACRLAEYVPADLMDPSACRAAIEGMDVLVHCAGLAHRFTGPLTSADYFRVNAESTRRIIDAAALAGVHRVVLISSSSVYGPGRSMATELDEPRPDSPYGASKLRGETEAAFACGDSIPLTVLRPATVYGVGDPGNIRRLIESVLLKRFRWLGSGVNHKSLVPVEDVADAVATVLSHPPIDMVETYNVAAPPLAMREIVNAISKAAKADLPLFGVPAAPVRSALALASIATLNRGPLSRVRRTVEKWVSEDTISSQRFERRFSHRDWRGFPEEVEREVAWLHRLLEMRPDSLAA